MSSLHKSLLAVSTLYLLALNFLIIDPAAADDSGDVERDLTDLSFEELMDLEVTSVGKKSQKLSDAAAAVFVITNEDLMRSGATSLPEALRMVPGISVAQIDGNKWSVSARGFSSRFANKLLVLIDGRSIYTATFSGVYWEIQDVVLEDVDRIEVIRGPGATLWGANAVNGVINIITRSAHETQDGLLTATAGTEEQQSLLRYGGRVGRHTAYRAFAKYVDRDEFETPVGDSSGDGWSLGHIGFRMDSERPSGDQFTLQGDFIDADIRQNLNLVTVEAPYRTFTEDRVDTQGWNVLGRWQKPLSVSSDMSLQLFVDDSRRVEGFVGQKTQTADVEFQHRFGLGGRHDWIWGIGYRRISDEFMSTESVSVDPAERKFSLWNAFLQDDITILEDQLRLTAGVKVEHNEFTGTEVQPNLRLIWTPGARHSIWAAVSEAVRTPSRAERDSRLWTSVVPPRQSINPSPFPALLVAVGNPELQAEELTAYELGYRFAVTPRLNLDLALFHNDYERLRTANLSEPTLVDFSYVDVPLVFSNGGLADTRGFELVGEWRPTDRWRLHLSYSQLDVSFRTYPGVVDLENTGIEGASPEHQMSLRSSVDLSENLKLNLWARFVDEVTPPIFQGQIPRLPDYWDLDIHLTWQPSDQWKFSLVGQNLLESGRLEGFQESFSASEVEVQRGYYATVSWKF